VSGQTKPDVHTQCEFDSCLHVEVCGARSERSAVALARNYASEHYGRTVGHYVSSGGSTQAGGAIAYTYVFSVPEADARPVRPRAERSRASRA
jgi:hypothetical protein